jgi:hypothetical protein
MLVNVGNLSLIQFLIFTKLLIIQEKADSLINPFVFFIAIRLVFMEPIASLY